MGGPSYVGRGLLSSGSLCRNYCGSGKLLVVCIPHTDHVRHPVCEAGGPFKKRAFGHGGRNSCGYASARIGQVVTSSSRDRPQSSEVLTGCSVSSVSGRALARCERLFTGLGPARP